MSLFHFIQQNLAGIILAHFCNFLQLVHLLGMDFVHFVGAPVHDTLALVHVQLEVIDHPRDGGAPGLLLVPQ